MTVGGTDIGATLGEFQVEMSQEVYYPDLQQAPMPVAGTGKVISASGKITVTLAEWQYSVLSLLFASYGSNSSTSQTIGSGSIGTVTELDNIIVNGLEKNSGKDVKITMIKGRITSPLGATSSKAQETGIEVTFESLSVINGIAHDHIRRIEHQAQCRAMRGDSLALRGHIAAHAHAQHTHLGAHTAQAK